MLHNVCCYRTDLHELTQIVALDIFGNFRHDSSHTPVRSCRKMADSQRVRCSRSRPCSTNHIACRSCSRARPQIDQLPPGPWILPIQPIERKVKKRKIEFIIVIKFDSELFCATMWCSRLLKMWVKRLRRRGIMKQPANGPETYFMRLISFGKTTRRKTENWYKCWLVSLNYESIEGRTRRFAGDVFISCLFVQKKRLDKREPWNYSNSTLPLFTYI